MSWCGLSCYVSYCNPHLGLVQIFLPKENVTESLSDVYPLGGSASTLGMREPHAVLPFGDEKDGGMHYVNG